MDAEDTGTTHKTAEACKAMFEDSKSHDGCKIGLLSQTMLKTWTRCAKSWRRRIRTRFPMAAFLMSSTSWDKTRPATPSIMKHIVEINKFFRNHPVPSAWLKGQLGSTPSQLPSETCWKGQLICLDSYLTNRTYYIKFIQDHPDEVDRTIVQKIMDVNMFQQVSNLANMLRPVTTALDLGQSDKTTLLMPATSS